MRYNRARAALRKVKKSTSSNLTLITAEIVNLAADIIGNDIAQQRVRVQPTHIPTAARLRW